MKPEMKGQSTLPFDTLMLLPGTGLVKRISLPGQVREALFPVFLFWPMLQGVWGS